jgi:hypothetical protein
MPRGLAISHVHPEWQIWRMRTTIDKSSKTTQGFAALALFAVAACHSAAAGAPAVAAASPEQPRAATPDSSVAGEYAYTTARTGDLHDFDFLAGAWTLENRRLKKRLVGSNDWDEFPAVDCAQIYLGGLANADELLFPTKGWAGVTFRNFEIEKRQWSIYWVSSRTGKLYPPVVGGFDGDRGEFYGEDVDEGRPVKVRFLWVKHGPDHAHWEQAFSLDGKTWEVNWMNELTRADPATVCNGVRPRG